MFILYANVADSFLEIDKSEKEKDIVETILDYSNEFNLYDYLITKTKGEETDYKEAPYKRIIGKKQFANYLKKYKEKQKLNDMSCIELKRYILDKKDSRKI